MANEAKIPGEDFFKSLGKLEALAKGTSEQPNEEDMKKSQLFHTGSNSERQAWAGGDVEKYGAKWDDSIGKDGTDYHPARKAIAEKALKGLPMTPDEIAILKGDIEHSMEKAAPEAHTMGMDLEKAKKGEDEEEAKEGKESSVKSIEKSFEAIINESPDLQPALEMSEFLQEFAKAFGAGLGQVEARTSEMMTKSADGMLKQLGDYMDERFAEQHEFNKSLAEAVVNIGHGVAGSIEQTAEIAEQPAGAPKSHLTAIQGGVQPLEKSFAGPQGEEISKSQKLGVMCDMVEKGQLSSVEVCKFESTGQIRPDLDAQLINHIQSGGSSQ